MVVAALYNRKLIALDGNRLLNTASNDLIEHFVKKYVLDLPVIKRDAMSAEGHETQVDVRYDSMREVFDRNRPCLIPGQRIIVEVPVEGDMELLYARPSSYNLSPPRAEIRGQSLFFSFKISHDTEHTVVKQSIEASLNDIEGCLSTLRRDYEGFENSLRQTATQAITARRQRLLANAGRLTALGIPLKSRADAPRTYTLPEVRRKIIPTLPPASLKPYEPEPALDMANYEHILSVIQGMAQVMERSPSAFQAMGEEDLRQHFLVQLNGQFEGAATGETFNVKGKTDILLRANDRNVFIAECKYWKGPKHFRETIDQLLGYKAWRDTKTAILVFNRGTALTTVLVGVEAEAKAHKNFKRQESWKTETGTRYTFHHEGDTNREFLLTVLVFDVPGIPGEAL